MLMLEDNDSVSSIIEKYIPERLNLSTRRNYTAGEATGFSGGVLCFYTFSFLQANRKLRLCSPQKTVIRRKGISPSG